MKAKNDQKPEPGPRGAGIAAKPFGPELGGRREDHCKTEPGAGDGVANRHTFLSPLGRVTSIVSSMNSVG